MAKQYEYEFVRIDLGGFGTLKPKEDWQAIVREYAMLGWRLKQVMTPQVGGTTLYFELIFERER